MNGFYVFLPSNSSAVYYKDNTISHIWTKLEQRITLDDENWEVGLTEISFPLPIQDNRTRNKAGETLDKFTLPINIYVYCNIIKPQLIGDSRSRCLRIVDSSTRHQIFNPPYYFPLDTFDIESIEIFLADQFGEKIPFPSGDIPSILILHFRRRHW